eukprot:Pompholyxophrys_punicea_v1_NODE_138_length_3259_cov_5.175094.p2 type:complete len:216 gc:universal NODE_138_length_3259_cov_5.175094:1273-626(-)
MDLVERVVLRDQASHGVRLHAIYAAEYLNLPQKEVARIFGKDPATISRWIRRFHETGDVERIVRTDRYAKYLEEHRNWVISFVNKDPLCYLFEICKAFKNHFLFEISAASVWRILMEAGYSKKVIERRAMEISAQEVARFTFEFNLRKLFHHQLCFIDEMSTDNRSMLRKRGWFLRGQRPVFRGCFRRGARISILSFLGVDGLLKPLKLVGPLIG